MTESNQRLAANWKNRITIELTAKQMKSLRKGKVVKAVSNYVWYVIKPQEDPVVYDAKGKQLDKAALKKLLKRMA